jgi:hypothetical protein
VLGHDVFVIWASPNVVDSKRMDPHLYATLSGRLPKLASETGPSASQEERSSGAGAGAGASTGDAHIRSNAAAEKKKVFRKLFMQSQCGAIAGPYDSFSDARAAIRTEKTASRDNAGAGFAGSTRPWNAGRLTKEVVRRSCKNGAWCAGGRR